MHASPAPTRLLRGCNILSAQCVYWCKDKVLTRRRSDNQLLLVPVSWLSSSRMVSSWQQTHLVHLQYPIYIAHIFMPVRSFLRLSCAVQGRPAFTSRRYLDSSRCRRRHERLPVHSAHARGYYVRLRFCLRVDTRVFSYDSPSIEEFTYDDGHKLGPTEIYEFMSRVMYSRRSKMNPLWNSLLVGGVKDGQRLGKALSHRTSLSSYHS
jgi:hypothetical protein